MQILMSGVNALVDYLTISRIISLTIAFFLSGAISQFLSKGAVLKYFGPKAKKSTAYCIASVSGAILAVCSCSVLPMFASIRKKGAGLGPAVTFLFSGPAINILAITFTFRLIGSDIGFVRVSAAVIISIVIGLIMGCLFQKSEETDPNENMFNIDDRNDRTLWQNALFFILLLGVLISGVKHPIISTVFFIVLIVVLIMYFKKEELMEWCSATWQLAKKIVPLFIAGVFIAGILKAIIPQSVMTNYVGTNNFTANIMASVFGAFMYFATLTEVPIINSFMELGMTKGPAVAMLLAGPSLSLPNMIVISKIMGGKKTAVYVVLVVILSTLVGLIAGNIFL